MSDDVIELMCIAAAREQQAQDDSAPWDEYTDTEKEGCLRLMRAALEALESTAEQKALRAFEQAYLKWAMTEGGGQSEGDAFVELVEAYNEVEKARQS